MFHKERTFIVREVKKNSKSIFLYVSFGIYVHCNLLAMYRPVRMETKLVDSALYHGHYTDAIIKVAGGLARSVGFR